MHVEQGEVVHLIGAKRRGQDDNTQNDDGRLPIHDRRSIFRGYEDIGGKPNNKLVRAVFQCLLRDEGFCANLDSREI